MVLGGLDDAGPYLITPPNPTFQPLFTEAFNILSPGYIRVRLNVSRRDLIRLSIVGFASTFITIILGGSRKEYVRPPRAVIEDVFPIACVRCGRCAEACPKTDRALKPEAGRPSAINVPKATKAAESQNGMPVGE